MLKKWRMLRKWKVVDFYIKIKFNQHKTSAILNMHYFYFLIFVSDSWMSIREILEKKFAYNFWQSKTTLLKEQKFGLKMKNSQPQKLN